jgi:Skp family chaperone for outer membrane proteins
MAPERREAIITWLSESQLRPEAKARALAIIRRPELAEEDTQTILDIIQADIEADFAEVAGLEEDLKGNDEYQSFVAKHEAELSAIEKQVEEEVAELQDAAEEGKAKEDEEKLGDVKSRLGL